MKRNKAFTLIELVAVLVILAVISLIATPLLLNIIRRAKDVANKRSIDGYGRAVEYAMEVYQLKHLKYPDSFDQLKIEYEGNKVECKTNRINSDYSIYLSECKVNGKIVKDEKEFDGYYHYGKLKMNNYEYVDTYGANLENALKEYYDDHNEYPIDYTTLELPPLDKEVSCDVKINCDGTVKLTSCKVNGEDVYEKDTTEYYVYGEIPLATTCLLVKSNSKSITTYDNGNTHEMYTFEHGATEQTSALTDYRYIGSNPYNYVDFNGELWRIIGVFTVEDEFGNTEQRIKIIKNEKLSSNMAWDNNTINEWVTASLNNYLNGEYYNGLDSISQSMIAETKYYLGGSNNNTGSADVYYEFELGTTVYNGRSIYWIGKIALMYPSDYIYTYALGVNNNCYNGAYNCTNSTENTKGWIYNSNSNSTQWLLQHRSGYDSIAFYIHENGGIGNSSGATSLSYSVRPTLYLLSDIKVKSGRGTIDSPYEFEL